MKLNVVVSFFLFVTNLTAQTELIAFKSHSGNMAYFKPSGADNLGGPPIKMDSIIFINDSTIIEYSSWDWQGRDDHAISDTVVNHPICKVPKESIDSLKGIYYRNDIKFIHVDSLLEDSVKIDPSIVETEIIEEEISDKEIKKKRKKKENNTNVLLPLDDGGDLGNSISQSYSIYYFSVFLLLICALLGSFIWYTNKNKIVSA
jgi:hypothetical protein